MIGRSVWLTGANAEADALATNLFMTHCFQSLGNSADTIMGKVSAVRWYHLHMANHPVQLLHHKLTAALHQALAKASGGTPLREGLLLTTIMLGRARAEAAGPMAIATWRGVLLSFFALLRSSEIWADSAGRPNPQHCLTVGDVLFFRDGSPLTAADTHRATAVHLRQRSSKTDQRRVGSTIVLTSTGTGASDPVRLLVDILAALPHGTGRSHPLMTVRSRTGGLRTITRDEAGAAIKALALAHGLNPDRFHTHSPRIGAATTGAHNGLSDRRIQVAGRWRSDAFLAYVRPNFKDSLDISAKLAQPVDPSSLIAMGHRPGRVHSRRT